MNGVVATISKLLIYNPGKSRSTASIYLPPITPLEKQNLGQFLMLIEINSQDEINDRVIQLIEEELNRNYYGSENFNIEVAFENALQKTNQKLHELILAGQNSWLDKLNCLIAVHKGRELHFTQLGETHAFFIQGTKIINIAEQAGENATKINPLKIFSNVISGTINENDALLFCTTTLLDYLSQEKLRRIITENSSEKAVQILNQLLADNNNDVSFAAIILKLQAAEGELDTVERKVAEAVNAPYPTATESSMDSLINKERSTSELLTPSMWPNFTKGIKGFLTRLQKIWKKGKPEQTEERREERELPRDMRIRKKERGILMIVLGLIGVGLKKLCELIVLGIKGLAGLFQPRRRRLLRGQIRTLPHRTNRQAAKWLVALKNLSPTRRVILVIALLLLIIFAYNIVNLGSRAEKKQLKQQYADLVTQASEKTSEAEAALIYENEEDARVLLSEAKNLLTQVPSNQKELQNQINELSGKIQDQLNKVNHIVKIDNPAEFANLNIGDITASPKGIMLLGDTLYAYESNQNHIFSIDLDDQTVTAPETLGEVEGNSQRGIPLTVNRLLLYTSGNKFYEFNTLDNSFSEVEIKFANVDKTIQDFDTYLGRIYTLDTKNNQIFRHEKAGAGYGEGSAWITEEGLDITNATALAIDGSIYLTKNNGEVWKLFGGSKDAAFKVSTIDPAFSNPTQIITTPELENLYVLDPNNKRVVVLNKDGSLVNQYFSDSFDNLIDFSVSEANKAIYLLNEVEVYKVDI
ncbi:MAG: hypothetical protein COT24_02620 [Candidatus Kerfeldbacteria bacterium CG08_land_8_20_14_0_20_40_16]|uniref:PPM-type phosphatase domain-containing protein n=1 Tax=Candidatus Kerfeldbacteria bacterium CG08_land_8_20_14_0_20_40_16 TaxID=2014244 RepID=A0A2H0YVS8_9BACT|nr:MAG: hypothetical protein COT24_02620 [Candidatus Kerfeldbacteria bacterium CG08_land_8_20_14_0_20_40_16]